MERVFKIGVPRKAPTDHFVDNKRRKWVKASGFQEPYENEYFVWFKKDTVPMEKEIIFDRPIVEIFRYKYLLRCRVILGPKTV